MHRDIRTGFVDVNDARLVRYLDFVATCTQWLLPGIQCARDVLCLKEGGLGNAPEPFEDKLILEFKSVDDVSGEVFWTEVWSTDSVSSVSFERVFVPVDQPMHLTNGFQFRFRNYGAMGG